MIYFINIIKNTTHIILVAVLLLIPFNDSFASDMSVRLKGRILLQIESHGEAWYINPDNEKRYYLGRPEDAFQVMRDLGLGISNKDFNTFNDKIPSRLLGKILIKVEDSGKAYYVNQADLKMYYLGRPADAFQIMRKLGLGITNNNLSKILKYDQISTTKNNITTPTSSPVPIPVPKTSASVITSPPSSMVGINTHAEVFGTGADPNIITLGPKLGSHPDWPTYPAKHSNEVELKHGTPILAPIDMMFVGFQNNNAKYGIGADGQKYTPMNDLMLVFESASPDWPDMLIKTYHLYSSPLLPGHYQNPNCGESETPGKNVQTKGHLAFGFGDGITVEKGNISACEPLLGYKVKRGELIGYAGSVGSHTFASFGFKVQDTSINPTVKEGNPYLHWVQPSSFFYWKCYNPNASFPSGVLAYPFECDGYQLPVEQRDVNFKYK